MRDFRLEKCECPTIPRIDQKEKKRELASPNHYTHF